jgi:hypothetical protein
MPLTFRLTTIVVGAIILVACMITVGLCGLALWSMFSN